MREIRNFAKIIISEKKNIVSNNFVSEGTSVCDLVAFAS